MKDDFKPPIKSRNTEDLLQIVSSPKKWNPIALKLAEIELYDRKIDSKKIEQAKYLGAKKDRIEAFKIANENFCFFSINFCDLEPQGRVQKNRHGRDLAVFYHIVEFIQNNLRSFYRKSWYYQSSS